MSGMRVSEAAHLLGVSDDTVRRWLESGRLAGWAPEGGTEQTRRLVDPVDLARLMREEADGAASELAAEPVVARSARNRFAGLVTRVERDGVMALVEIQAGPHRVVSLMSREAADELRLEPGVRAVAAVKATNVVVEVPSR